MKERHRAERVLKELGKVQGISRRSALQTALALAASSAFSSACISGGSSRRHSRFSSHPFTLGVASGYPRPDGVTVWTRLAPAPLQEDGGMSPASVDVEWEVADDERFSRLVRSGRATATFEHAHTVHVDVNGLAPGRWYWYRFHAGDEVSAAGRTRTADAAGAEVARLRFAIGSCQNYEQGYYAAHRHLAEENLDLMLFLGDYIYADSWGDNRVRKHAVETARTLSEYRGRYAQYRMDADLQRMHAMVPWATVWDDGEVDNDWAAAQSEHLDPDFLARRTAALQAYFEHTPLPRRRPGEESRIYGELAFGNLARFFLLDDRLYRSPQVCPAPQKGGGGNRVYVDECADLARSDRTMLGPQQERWLDGALAASKEQWSVLAQQTLMLPADSEPGSRERVLTDMWSGYPSARARLIESLTRQRASNPIIVGGDIHATVAGDLHRLPADSSTPIVAAAFCGTSISSQGAPPGAWDAILRENPHLKFANTHQRGYLTLELTSKSCSVTLRALTSEKQPDSGITNAAKFVVEAGTPGVQVP
jgi:alkaline phosphatase D